MPANGLQIANAMRHLDGDTLVELFLAALEVRIAHDRTPVLILDACTDRLLQALG